MDSKEYESLKLENQLCFPLYACSKGIIKRYKEYLDPLDLTYTQYIVMMALWEYDSMTVTQLGEKLYLDSGTLTPLLKKLESKGYIERSRLPDDERIVMISLTNDGRDLREKAKDVPSKMGSCVRLSKEEADALYVTLYKLLKNMQ